MIDTKMLMWPQEGIVEMQPVIPNSNHLETTAMPFDDPGLCLISKGIQAIENLRVRWGPRVCHFFFFFLEMRVAHIPGWLGTCYTTEDGFKHPIISLHSPKTVITSMYPCTDPCLCSPKISGWWAWPVWTNPNLKQTRLVHMAKERVGGGREEGKEKGKEGDRKKPPSNGYPQIFLETTRVRGEACLHGRNIKFRILIGEKSKTLRTLFLTTTVPFSKTFAWISADLGKWFHLSLCSW